MFCHPQMLAECMAEHERHSEAEARKYDPLSFCVPMTPRRLSMKRPTDGRFASHNFTIRTSWPNTAEF